MKRINVYALVNSILFFIFFLFQSVFFYSLTLSVVHPQRSSTIFGFFCTIHFVGADLPQLHSPTNPQCYFAGMQMENHELLFVYPYREKIT